MRILVVHNAYQKPGGEDVVFQSEVALLESEGHEVVRHATSNDDVRKHGSVSLAANTVWNGAARREVQALIQRTRPDLMHVHNTFPLLSPSIYGAAQAEGVPVIQTLHNFRLLCPSAVLRRDGKVCEECIGTLTRWPGVVHRCYRNSRAATGAIAAMLMTHTLIGTWREKVTRFIALSEFDRDKFVEGGYPAAKIAVKPNFLADDPGLRTGRGSYALFVGRLSPEKGVGTLLEAIGRMAAPPLLKIAGQGPLMTATPDANPNIEWLGQQSRTEVFERLGGAALLIMPSEWYEGCPLVIIEAFARGVPVIASHLGTMAEMIVDGVTGLLFTPQDPQDLAAKIRWALDHPAEIAAMASRARQEFESKYSAARNYKMLMQIYEAALN
jgi:glycosyltransferase involved in cell wall biosynthesis